MQQISTKGIQEKAQLSEKVIHWELCKKLKFYRTDKWHMLKPKSRPPSYFFLTHRCLSPGCLSPGNTCPIVSMGKGWVYCAVSEEALNGNADRTELFFEAPPPSVKRVFCWALTLSRLSVISQYRRYLVK